MQKKFQTKNQHYVPQFYLRKFSKDGKRICLFNLEKEKLIPHAPLKHQCSRDYFYGENGVLESALGGMEAHFSVVFDKCLDLQKLGKISNEMFSLLAMFAVTQHMRTSACIKAFEEFGKKSHEAYMKRALKAEGFDLSAYDFTVETDEDFPRYVLRIGILNFPLMSDLECVVLKNETAVDFVLSDNPVVFQNPFLEKFIKPVCCGLASRGLQIFFPISPRYVVCFYDSDVYRFSGKNLVVLKSIKDVENLNRLQFFNAEKNVYFTDENTDVKDCLNFWKSNKVWQLSRVGEYMNVSNPNEFLFRISTDAINIGFRLSIFNEKPAMLKAVYQKKAYLRKWIRNPKLSYLVNEYHKAVDAGECQASDFEEFRNRKVDEILNSIKRRKWMNSLK